MHMKRKIITLNIVIFLIFILSSQSESIRPTGQITVGPKIDWDPLVDIVITVEFLSIRALESIDNASDPDFFIKAFVNRKEYISPIWYDTHTLTNCWNITANVPDDQEIVTLSILLFDSSSDRDRLCDISKDENRNGQGYSLNLTYNVKTGRWNGDDYLGDYSGYGRACGCDDGSIYKNERDCELCFRIYQNDYDYDGLPYWIETYEYKTNPLVDNRGQDDDADEIPIEWEHTWGYNPFSWDDHHRIDIDNDSITNFEEYLTGSLGSDPLRKDLFLEIDIMPKKPEGNVSIITDQALDLLKIPFHKRNIVFHIDMGEIIPFDSFTNQKELLDIYQNYFIHNITYNWRRSVFHYGIFVHNCFPTGYSFAGDGPEFWGYIPSTNSFVVSSSQMERYSRLRPMIPLDFFHASVIMHEMGHNFGLRFGNPPGCDNQYTKYPWQFGWWVYRNYESTMNYRYTYEILDYSDGSHGSRDFDDWSHINLSYFEPVDVCVFQSNTLI